MDETGQDTAGNLFIVAIVIIGSLREELREILANIEKESEKHQKKWMKATRAQRATYIAKIIERPQFVNLLYYNHYQHTKNFFILTVRSTAQALHTHTKASYEATILVDGLPRTERHHFGSELRHLGVSVRKVRGIRDQSDEFIRLADAIAGLVRDALGGDELMKVLFEKTMDNHLLKETVG